MTKPHTKHERDVAAARAWAVLWFGAGALFALVGAVVEAYNEGGSWSEHTPRGYAVFAIASLVAATLAWRPTASIVRPLVAPGVLVPAALLVTEHDLSIGGRWGLVVAAAALLVGGGVFAGGGWNRLGGP